MSGTVLCSGLVNDFSGAKRLFERTVLRLEVNIEVEFELCNGSPRILFHDKAALCDLLIFLNQILVSSSQLSHHLRSRQGILLRVVLLLTLLRTWTS